MAVELDHIFIRVTVGAPEAGRLADFGFIEGPPNRHPGQGTACRRFFFRNAMLELLWVEDSAAAAGSLQLTERRSPFGICVRPADEGHAVAPFATWEYRPAYLPAGHVIHMASERALDEPLCFFLGFGRSPAMEQPVGFQNVTGVRIITPAPVRSDAMKALVAEHVLTVESGPEHRLELTLEDARAGRSHDFRPELPLVFHW